MLEWEDIENRPSEEPGAHAVAETLEENPIDEMEDAETKSSEEPGTNAVAETPEENPKKRNG